MTRNIDKLRPISKVLLGLSWQTKCLHLLLPISLLLVQLLIEHFFSSNTISFLVAILFFTSSIVYTQVWALVHLKVAFLRGISNGTVVPDKGDTRTIVFSAQLFYVSLFVGSIVLSYFGGPILLIGTRTFFKDQQIAFLFALILIFSVVGWIAYRTAYIIDVGLQAKQRDLNLLELVKMSAVESKGIESSTKVFFSFITVVIFVKFVFPELFGTSIVPFTIQVVLVSAAIYSFQYFVTYDYYNHKYGSDGST